MTNHRKTEEQNELKVDKLIDRPINSEKDDALGFSALATSLVEAIEAQPNHSSLTLGLDGVWGSGKSSVLELMQNSIKDREHKDGIGLVIVHFSPWMITNRTALVASFFAQLGTAIDAAEKRLPKKRWYNLKKGTAKTLSKIRGPLNKFSGMISIASTATSLIDPTTASAITAGGAKAVEQLTRDKSGKTLEVLKSELTTALREVANSDPTFRILVLIDDLDRLDPNDALEVLRLVKAVGDFPAITYLLAYDKNAIASAIEHSAKIDKGDVYLEKIIQFSFKIPPLEPFQLRNWLRGELNNLFPEEIDFGSKRAVTVLDIWAGRLLKTPRDVKRLLFSLRAMWPKLKGQADLLDLIWLQMITQKASAKEIDLYTWLVGYLQVVEALAIGAGVTGQLEDRQKLVQILSSLGWKTYDRDNDRASFDFHNLDEFLVGVTESYLGSLEKDWTHKIEVSELQEFRNGKRLSSPWHWRLYFAFDPPSHAITDSEWDVLIVAAKQSIDELSKSMKLVLEVRGKHRADAADQIINRAKYEAVSDKLQHPDRWIIATIQQAACLAERSKKSFFGFYTHFDYGLKDFTGVVFNKLEGELRKETLLSIFDKPENICVAADLLREQFHASKAEEHEKKRKFFLTEKELKEVSQLQINLYQELTPEGFRQLSSPYSILYAWFNVSSSDEGPKKLLEEAFATDQGLLETLEALRYVSTSAQNGVPHIPENYLKKFIDTDPVKVRLEAIADSSTPLANHAKKLLKLWWDKSFDE